MFISKFSIIQSVRVVLSVASKGVRVKQAYVVLDDVATMQLFRKLQDRKQSMLDGCLSLVLTVTETV